MSCNSAWVTLAAPKRTKRTSSSTRAEAAEWGGEDDEVETLFLNWGGETTTQGKGKA